MQHTDRLSSSVDWQPGAAPKAACVLQAALFCAAVAVIFQAVVNWWLGIATLYLHLGGFLMVFPVAWWFLADGRYVQTPSAVLRRVCFEERGIVGELGQTGQPVTLQLLGVGRFWGAMLVRLKLPAEINHGCTIRPEKIVSVTIWKAIVGQEKFRKISLMTHWHARRMA